MNFGVISYGQPQNNNSQNLYTTQHTFGVRDDYNNGIGSHDLSNIYDTYGQSTFGPALDAQGKFN